MTIVTKPITDKKSDKLEQPLVDNEINESLPTKVDIEATAEPEPQYLLMRARARRVSTATTVCLFLTALIVMCIGIVGGVFLYRQFAKSQMHRIRGWCKIPLAPGQQEAYKMSENSGELTDDILRSRLMGSAYTPHSSNGFFKEEFEFDETLNYEKINVPDFSNGRRGRFIHDFNSNKTGIIDLDGHRCFVMPLNRRQVLPPRSLFDLIRKMWEGYYDVDTEIVRDTMKVITPPISDMQSVGQYISRECNGVPTYMLEKDSHPVFKRSVNSDDLPSAAKFAEFAGKNIVEIDIINLEEAIEYEKAQEKEKKQLQGKDEIIPPVAAASVKKLMGKDGD